MRGFRPRVAEERLRRPGYLPCPGLAHALAVVPGGIRPLPPPSPGRAVDNPFLRADSVNDCDVLKYNGDYHITGNWLAGQMLFSRDLVNWGNRRKVITHVGGWATTHPYDDLQISLP